MINSEQSTEFCAGSALSNIESIVGGREATSNSKWLTANTGTKGGNRKKKYNCVSWQQNVFQGFTQNIKAHSITEDGNKKIILWLVK